MWIWSLCLCLDIEALPPSVFLAVFSVFSVVVPLCHQLPPLLHLWLSPSLPVASLLPGMKKMTGCGVQIRSRRASLRVRLRGQWHGWKLDINTLDESLHQGERGSKGEKEGRKKTGKRVDCNTKYSPLRKRFLTWQKNSWLTIFEDPLGRLFIWKDVESKKHKYLFLVILGNEHFP